MKRIHYYGVSRSRDRGGQVVKRELTNYTMCVHPNAASGFPTMLVLIAEVYDSDKDTDGG